MLPSSLSVPGESPGVMAGVGVSSRCDISWPGENMSEAETKDEGAGLSEVGSPLRVRGREGEFAEVEFAVVRTPV